MRRVSAECVAAIKGFEGCRLVAYRCGGGVWTVGYGHTAGVREGDTITQVQADAFLYDDLSVCESFVEGLRLSLSQGQFDALVDFAFNCGVAALEGSTLLRKIRSGASSAVVQEEFKRWNKAGGTVQPGLVRRRAWEARRWVS